MGTIFADTNYFVALLDPKDDLHAKALEVSKKLPGNRTLTTDFVLIEMLRLFSKRGQPLRQTAATLVNTLRNDPNCEVIPASRDLFNRAFTIYNSHEDKEWDIVDCASKVAMQEKGINEALTYDEHFKQMGFRALLREE